LKEFGPTPLHRLSFAPVWMCNAVPQEVFGFMDEDEEAASIHDDTLVDPDDSD
jgi:hypothetical protein